MLLFNQAFRGLNTLEKINPLLLSLPFVGLTTLAGTLPRASFVLLVGAFSGACLLSFLMMRYRQQSWAIWLMTGIAARILLLFTLPNLSDDIYRFYWDGRISLLGLHPFHSTPAELMRSGHGLPADLLEIYPFLNSQAHHTVYPMICQWLFRTAAWLSHGSLMGFTIAIKCILFLAECGSLFLLAHLSKKRDNIWGVTLYAVNPLVILELVGNTHFEALAIFFLLCMYVTVIRRQWIPAGIALAAGIATKLIPLLALPIFMRRLSRRQFAVFAGIAAVTSLILFLPLTDQLAGKSMLDSLDLYFRKFEFNASLYYICREIGYWYAGYNLIAMTGPALAITGVLCMCLYLLKERHPHVLNFPIAMVVICSMYYVFATTVHPWYLTVPLAFASLSGLRFPVAWACLSFLSYSAYRFEPVIEQPLILTLEYGAVALFAWLDYRQGRFDSAPVLA